MTKIPMIYDVVTFNGEYDLLELRLNILDPHVDQFIIVEAPTTFSGHVKPLYWVERPDGFEEWEDKIKYHVIDENYSDDEIALAESSPNTQGAEHWKHEFLQKESIKKALTHLDDDDIVFIGDVDEIWESPYAEAMGDTVADGVSKLRLRVYAYYLNNRSSEEYRGTIAGKYKNIKGECLNHLRNGDGHQTWREYGWHFTSMGGVKELQRKLNDSYTTDSYNTHEVQAKLPERYGKEDFLGRDFTYKLDESEWPKYLKDNREKYKHLCR